MTAAQLIYYMEALAQLNAPTSPEPESLPQPAARPPRRLKGKAKEEFYAMVREQHGNH